MLNRNKWWTAAHQDAYKRSMHMLMRQPWSSVMTIVMISVTLMIAVLCGMTSHHLSAMSADWQKKEDIALYLQPQLNEAAQQQFLEKVRLLPEVESAVLTTPAEGFIWLQQQAGMQDIAQYLPTNPLPAMIQVVPNASVQTPEAIKHISQTLQGFSEVAEVKFDLDWAERLYAGLGFLNQVLRCLIGLFALSVVLVIGNTLRLLIHNRYDEIRVLQCIGAPDKFIIRPFLYASVWYGLLASLLAIIFADTLLIVLRTGLSQWAEVYHIHVTIPLLPVLWILGLTSISIGLSWTGARLTLKYYI